MLSDDRLVPWKHAASNRWIRAVIIGIMSIACSIAVVSDSAGAQDQEMLVDPADEVIDQHELEFFERHVRPILVARCYECHSSDEVNGGLELDTRDGWRLGGDSGAAIVPGDPDASLLLEAISYRNLDLQMPPDGELPADEVARLREWIERGAHDPRQGSVSEGVAPSGMSIEVGREFWSLQPLQPVSMPSSLRDDWIRNPLDAFVLERLEEHGLRPAPRADRRTLIRRLSFDLIGLPPTPGEIDEFLADDQPGAWERLVDRLLASPRYGERWGRHWLDVARYADSNGLDENLAYGHAWRYRDYVVNAFNQDLSFDRFLLEQLAGDLIENADRDSLIATGFLTLGATVLAEPDREKLVMDTVDEQIDTTGKAFLGLTLGCARCHDHKFDPIKQTDYYALAAIFKSTTTYGETQTGVIKHWYEHQFATAEQIAEIEAIEKEISDANSAATQFKNKAFAEVREQAMQDGVEYLAAALFIEPEFNLDQIASIATPRGLHPRILHHCRLHLEYHSDEVFFARWHTIADAADEENAERLVRQHYEPLFASAREPENDAPSESESSNTDGSEVADDDDPMVDDGRMVVAAREALRDASGFLAIPPQAEFALAPDVFAEYEALLNAARILESGAPDLDAAMGVCDGVVLDQLPLHIRGSHRNLGPQVRRGVPQVFLPAGEAIDLPPDASGRLEVAQWLVEPQHPLTARVYVNRLWRWHFGEGIVKTTENFGALGAAATHPDLLDYLANRLIESGWSTKQVHRLILLSNTYQMSSSTDHQSAARAMQVDPANRWLWRFRLRRLEVEPIRDSMLFVADRLDLAIGGKTIPLRNRQFVFNHTSRDHTTYDSTRRSVYLPVVRNHLYSWFAQFDFPDPTMPTGDRHTTVVAPQALHFLNAPEALESADHFALRLMSSTSDPSERLRLAYLIAFSREPTVAETAWGLEFVQALMANPDLGFESTSLPSAVASDDESRSDTSETRAWSVFCQCLFASNEFIYVR